MDVNMDHLQYVINACFILHNFCEIKEETLADESVIAAIRNDNESQPPILGNRHSLGNTDEKKG